MPGAERKGAPPGAAPTLLGRSGRVKRKAGRRGLLLVPLLVLAACAQPGFRPETPAGRGPVVRDIPGARLSVEAEAWNARPASLPEAILPLLVTLANTGDVPLAIARADFALLDEDSRQSFPLPPAEVVTMLGGGGAGLGVTPAIGVSGTSAGGTIFGAGLGIVFGAGRETRDILPLALADGPVLPGAETRGYLYFPRPAPSVQALRLVATLRDLPGAPRLEFPFRRSP